MPQRFTRGQGNFGRIECESLMVAGNELFSSARRKWFVSPTGSDSKSGKTRDRAFLTLEKAVDVASAGDFIGLVPGEHAEAGLVPAAKSNLTIIGLGGRGAAWFKGTGGDDTALTVHGDDITLVNVGAEGQGAGAGLVVTGQRFRAYVSKFEGGANPAELIGGRDPALAVAGSGKAGDYLFEGCEFAWSAAGLKLSQGFVGAVTQAVLRACVFHNLTASHVVDGSGVASGLYRNLTVDGCLFCQNEDGTDPTKYFSINSNNTNTGLVTGCRFPVAINSGLNLVSTAVKWLANYHPAGLSTGQPS